MRKETRNRFLISQAPYRHNIYTILRTLVGIFTDTGQHHFERWGPHLIGDDEIQKPNGIIPYVLTGDERYLDLRTFKDKVKKAIWEKQNHKCAICGKEFDFELMEGDHIKPWREGGRTDIKNCQMLCRQCNRSKGCK